MGYCQHRRSRFRLGQTTEPYFFRHFASVISAKPVPYG